MKKKERNNNMLIFFLALLTVYLVLTSAAAVLFEYYTVSESKGEIIFSFAMSWQLILFVIEIVSIVIQGIMLIKMMGNPTQKRYKITRYTGLAAGGTAIITAIILLFTQGLVLNPTVIFSIYGLLILVIRGILLPKAVRNAL